MNSANKPKAKARCCGRQEPSKEELDRFLEIYLEFEGKERKARGIAKNG